MGLSNIIQVLVDYQDEIEISGKFLDSTVYWDESASPDDILEAEKMLNRDLPDELKEFYQKIDGLELRWKYQSDWGVFQGVSDISSIGRLLNKKMSFAISYEEYYEDFWWSKWLEENHSLILDRLFVFDNLGQGDLILIYLPENSKDYKFYLFQYPNFFEELFLSISEYIEYTLESRGFYFWQKYFIANHENEVKKYGISYHLPEIFPNSSQSSLIKKCKHKDSSLRRDVFLSHDRYIEKFHQLENVLKSIGGIKIERFHVNPGVSFQTIERVNRFFGITMPSEMVNFYKQINGVHIRWSYILSEDLILDGMIWLLPVEDIFGGPNGLKKKEWSVYSQEGVLWEKNLIEEEPNWFNTVKVFNPIEKVFEAKYVVVNFNNQNDKSIYLLQFDNPIKMTLNFREYLEALLNGGGVENWHYFATYSHDFQISEPNELINKTLLSKVFPKFDVFGLRKP